MPTEAEDRLAPCSAPGELAVAWRSAREDSQDAYRAWCRAARDVRRDAYAVFLAAADREAAAERGYLTALDPGRPAPDGLAAPRS
jgi:hypothetical protein